MRTIQTIIEEHGGLASVERMLRIENEPHRPLELEVSKYAGDIYVVDVCHVWEEENSPWIAFRVTPGEPQWEWLPLLYHDEFKEQHQRVTDFAPEDAREGTVSFNVTDPKLLVELKHVAAMWDILIGQQGYLEAYRRLKAGGC